MAKRNCEAKNPVVAEFLKWLDTSPHLSHLSWYQRFRAVIELWFASITANEEVYQERVKELTPDAVREGAVKHFSELWYEMMQDPRDLLGDAYQAYSVRDTKRLAQYFTPDTVAAAMASMSLSDATQATFRKPGGCRILEPACGTGMMLIHALSCIETDFGQWGLNRTEVVACDIDPLCAMMAAIQLWWFPAMVGSVVVMQGDSLAGNQKTIARFGMGIPTYLERRVRKTESEVLRCQQ